MSFAENDVFNPLCLVQHRVTHNWHPRALSNYLWIPSPISKQGGSVITWDIAAIMMLRFNNAMLLLPTSLNSTWNALTQSKILLFIKSRSTLQMTYARHSLIRLWHYSAVATKQERILLNQVKTRKTPQGKVLKRYNIINGQMIQIAMLRQARAGPRRLKREQ